MSISKRLKGGCYCGRVRYELTEPLKDSVLCHCRNCRRISGGQAVPWILTEEGRLQFTEGTPKSYFSETEATWTFCQSCGTTLTYKGKDYKDRIDVALISLDEHESWPPGKNANVAEKLEWVNSVHTMPGPGAG